jgi:hypothetical protein
MRLIERQMIAAILDCKDWSKDNTRVVVTYFAHAAHPIERINVYLHDNNIATIEHDQITINNCGWFSPTTKSRLNAILHEFSSAGIYQKDHKWFLETPYSLTQMENRTDYTIMTKYATVIH